MSKCFINHNGNNCVLRDCKISQCLLKRKPTRTRSTFSWKRPILFQKLDTMMAEGAIEGVLLCSAHLLSWKEKINEQLYFTLFSTYNLEITDNLWKYAFLFQLPEFLSKLSLKTHRKSALNNYCEIMSLCCPDEGWRFYGQTSISQHTLAGSIIMLMICIIFPVLILKYCWS